MRRVVVALIAVEFLGPETWAAWLSNRATNWRDGVHQWLKLLGVMNVSGGERGRERNTLPIDNQVVLRATLTPVGRIRARSLAPFFARTLVLSILARSRSMASRSPSHCRSVLCARVQMPAFCHSRRRRQQLTLLAPTSRGTSRQRHPWRST